MASCSISKSCGTESNAREKSKDKISYDTLSLVQSAKIESAAKRLVAVE